MTTDARAILGDIIAWQRATFGTTPRPAGLAKHIAKEAAECAAEPANLVEWLDVVFLGLHGAHSCAGADLDAILDGLAEKLAENERRTWKVPAGDVTVEHDRAGEVACRVCSRRLMTQAEWAALPDDEAVGDDVCMSAVLVRDTTCVRGEPSK